MYIELYSDAAYNQTAYHVLLDAHSLCIPNILNHF